MSCSAVYVPLMPLARIVVYTILEGVSFFFSPLPRLRSPSGTIRVPRPVFHAGRCFAADGHLSDGKGAERQVCWVSVCCHFRGSIM